MSVTTEKIKYTLPENELSDLIHIIKILTVDGGDGKKRIYQKDVSGNITFLEECGFITWSEEGWYVPTKDAIYFSEKHSWNPDLAKSKLRKILKKCWFCELVIESFQSESVHSEENLIKKLSLVSKTSKDEEYKLKILLNFLEYSMIIQKDDDNLYFLFQDNDMLPEHEEVVIKQSMPVVVNININVPKDIDSIYISRVVELIEEIGQINSSCCE